ncbi:MAG: MCP four helix bundle domain-containing protein [Bryobacterales bacterium]|nr:MCP four helix bundle domain-containing protein [Bryobacteraceae bacterium]MDW8353319.1 MCP four helix bundle domain-containing protein [Bryobacterales bacterium]
MLDALARLAAGLRRSAFRPASQLREVTPRTILRVLLAGFTLVILLLLVAGYFSVRSIRSIRENAATVVNEQAETSRLIEEVRRGQLALNAVLYNLARGPESVDRDEILSQLKATSNNVQQILEETKGTLEEKLGQELRQATEAFTAEATRLLAQEAPTTLLSRDLIRRHQQVLQIVTRLMASSHDKAQTAQQMIDQQSRQLFARSFTLLGACLALAAIFALATVRLASDLLRKMEWQASELSRVSWHLMQHQETTARRFSHELHDELGQALTAVKANLVPLAAQGAGSPAVEDCIRLVDEALRNVRELSHLLRPIILDDFGLDAGLRWLAERFAQRTGIEVEYSSTFAERLADETETHLFRIAQEALTNVARHAGATKVKMELAAQGGELRLTIRDNGRGLPETTAAEAGMGMTGMRARARSAGGELRVLSAPGAGVQIEARVPLKAVRHEQPEDSHLARR